MRSIATLVAIAALVAAPLAAQGRTGRAGDVINQTKRTPSTVLGQVLGQEGAERERTGRKAGHIPPGHMPAAGMCRVWIDGVPPGQQPAPTDCQTAVAGRPSNARVLFGGDGTPQLKSNGKPSKPGKAKVKHKIRNDDEDRSRG